MANVTKQARIVGRKLAALLVAVAASAVLPTGAHVFDDAAFLWRGGKDANGDGFFQPSELRDTTDISASRNVSVGISNFVRFTNEVVHCPYSGKTVQSSCIYLPQPITHTFTTNIVDNGDGTATTNVTKTARGRVSKVYIKDAFRNVTGNCSNYTAIIRFRREAIPKVDGGFQDWLLRIGYVWDKSGLAIGYNGDTMTNRYLQIFAGGLSGFSMNAANWMSTTETNAWTDIGVTVDGWTMKVWYVQEGGPLMKGSKTYTYTNPSSGRKLTQFAAQSSWTVEIGSELDMANEGQMYNKVGSEKATSHNAYKCFRGSVQQLGIWTRTLSEAEILEAMGAPAPALVRVGLGNGTSTEFASTVTTVGTADWENLNPSLAAGGSLSVAFTNDAVTRTLPQVLTLIPTPASGSGAVRVTLNGKTVKTVPVAPGYTNDVFVATNFFLTGANTLTLTRADSGATPIVFDTFYLAGSWIEGRFSLQNDVFPAEHLANTHGTHYAGSDWHWYWRGLTAPSKTAKLHTFHFPVERRLVDRGYAFRFRHYVNSVGHNNNEPAGRWADFELNGTKLATNVLMRAGTFTYDFPAELVQDGMNTFAIRSVTGEGGLGWANFSWHAVDFIPPPVGTLLIIR